MDIETRLTNLETQLFNLATRQSDRSNNSDNGISEAKARTEAVKREVENTVSEAWNERTLYQKDDYVLYQNSTYICLFDNIGVEPTDDIYWQKVNIVGELNRLNKMIKEMER